MCQINTLRTFRWHHLLIKPEKTYAYTWYLGYGPFDAIATNASKNLINQSEERILQID